MTRPSFPAPARAASWRRRIGLAVVATALGAGALAAIPADAAPQRAAATGASSAAARVTAPPTRFQIATFNVLGHSHTVPGGDRAAMDDGRVRMVRAVQLLDRQGIDVAGFQELEPIQFDKFVQLTGPRWQTWPGRSVKDGTFSSIGWRTSEWTAIEKSIYSTPYFYGRSRPRPLVLLRNNATGQLVWVTNTHNPSNTRGDAQKWRDDSERIQAQVVNRLRASTPTIPVLFTGDMNDRERFYCPVTYLTTLESASGGFHQDVPGGACEPAKPVQIDWIMGTPDIAWSGYTALRDSLVQATTDHPLVYATASVAPQPARAAGVKRVVVIDAQGVRSQAVSRTRTPNLARLLSSSAATLNARPDSTTALPGTISMLSGRTVARSTRGHGVGARRDPGGTVHRAARQYVSSIFDVAHNLGLRTAFYSGDRNSAIVARTWAGREAGRDGYGVDNGRSKISSRLFGTDRQVSAATTRSIARTPAALTVVQFNDALEAGQKYGFSSARYLKAVRGVDSRIAGVLAAIRRNPSTASSTMVIVTAGSTSTTARRGHGVPLVVYGAGVRAGDLYRLNPAWTDPGSARTSRRPLRTGDVANLVMTALNLPAVPRSTYNTGLSLAVTGR